MRPNQQGAAESTGGRRLHPFFRDVGITLLGQIVFTLLTVFLYRLLAQKTGTDGFASFTLTRQAVIILLPVITVGLMGGLPRYLALPAEERTPSAEAYLLAAAGMCGASSACGALLALAFPDAVAELFFGDSSRTELVTPMAALLLAMTLFQVTYSYYRGLLRVRVASAVQIGAAALPPPLIVLIFEGESIHTIILLVALALGAVSAVAIGAPLFNSFRRSNRRRVRAAARDLMNYGPRRVPGEIAHMALHVTVPILGAHVASLTAVAYLGAGQQVLAMLSVAVLPLSLVLLPSVARMWANDRESARGYVAQLVAFSLHVAIFLSFQTVLYADIAVTTWLGSGFDAAGPVVRVVVAPGALFVVHLMLRSTLDAVEVRAYNSRNSLIALALFATLAAALLSLDLARPVMCVAWAFAAGVTAQGLLTLFTVHRVLHLSASAYMLPVAVLLGIATGAAGLAARPLIDGSGAELPLLVGLELVLALVYFGTLTHLRAGWVVLLRERLFSAGG